MHSAKKIKSTVEIVNTMNPCQEKKKNLLQKRKITEKALHKVKEFHQLQSILISVLLAKITLKLKMSSM